MISLDRETEQNECNKNVIKKWITIKIRIVMNLMTFYEKVIVI